MVLHPGSKPKAFGRVCLFGGESKGGTHRLPMCPAPQGLGKLLPLLHGYFVQLTLPGWGGIFSPVPPARMDAVRIAASITCFTSHLQPWQGCPRVSLLPMKRRAPSLLTGGGQELPPSSALSVATSLLCSSTSHVLWLHLLIPFVALPLGCGASSQLSYSGCLQFLVPQWQCFYLDC